MELQISWSIDILVALRQPCLGKSHHAAVPEVFLEPNVPWSLIKTHKNQTSDSKLSFTAGVMAIPSCDLSNCMGSHDCWVSLFPFCYRRLWGNCCLCCDQIKLKFKLRLQKSCFCLSEQLRASGAFTAPSAGSTRTSRRFLYRKNKHRAKRTFSSLWLKQKHLYTKQLIWHIRSKDKWNRNLSSLWLSACGDFINLHHVCAASLLQWSQCHIPDVSLSGLTHPHISSQGQRSPASGYHLAGPAVTDQSPTRLNVLTADKAVISDRYEDRTDWS